MLLPRHVLNRDDKNPCAKGILFGVPQCNESVKSRSKRWLACCRERHKLGNLNSSRGVRHRHGSKPQKHLLGTSLHTPRTHCSARDRRGQGKSRNLYIAFPSRSAEETRKIFLKDLEGRSRRNRLTQEPLKSEGQSLGPFTTSFEDLDAFRPSHVTLGYRALSLRRGQAYPFSNSFHL
jgi:hypothetical protein